MDDKIPYVTDDGELGQTYQVSRWSVDEQNRFHTAIGRLCANGGLLPPTIRRQFRAVTYPQAWFDHLVLYTIPTSTENVSTQRSALGGNTHISWITCSNEWERICWRNRYDAFCGVDIHVKTAHGTNDVYWPSVYNGKAMYGDRLADWFTERYRNQARRNGSYSRHESWTARGKDISQDAATWNDGVVSMKTLAKSWFYKSANVHAFALHGAKAFYVLVYTFLRRERVASPGVFNILDSSTGWGGSALAAMALDQDPSFSPRVAYTGVEPNAPLHHAYSEMQSVLGFRPGSATFLLDSFEHVDIESLRSTHGPFDLVFTSPPFFDHEWYDTVEGTNGGQTSRQQSTWYVRRAYKNGASRDEALNCWLNDFLFPCVDRWAYTLDDNGGILALHIDDYGGTKMIHTLYRYIAQTHPELRRMGMIPMYRVANQTPQVQPVHIWMKES